MLNVLGLINLQYNEMIRWRRKDDYVGRKTNKFEAETKLSRSVSNAHPKEETEINKSKNVTFFSMTGHCFFFSFKSGYQ
jgi:hypothetical protein